MFLRGTIMRWRLWQSRRLHASQDMADPSQSTRFSGPRRCPDTISRKRSLRRVHYSAAASDGPQRVVQGEQREAALHKATVKLRRVATLPSLTPTIPSR